MVLLLSTIGFKLSFNAHFTVIGPGTIHLQKA